jgi:hypothetical protein
MAGPSKTASKTTGNSASTDKDRYDIPNGRLLLESIGLTRERLNAGPRIKVPVPASLLKELLLIAASNLPFDQEFYLENYPDIAKAIDHGRVSSARAHFIEEGFLEGRFGSKPQVDEGYYKNAYPDVAAAVNAGGIASALEHYMRAGAYEARIPNPVGGNSLARWMTILGK